MEREKINRYFIDLLKDILSDYPEFAGAFMVRSGMDYEDSLAYNYADTISYEYDVQIMCGATKLVIVSDGDLIGGEYVLKVPFLNTTYNYCDLEVEKYDEIVGSFPEYKELFAETWCCGDITIQDREGFDYELPLYVMKRAVIDEEKVENSSYDYWKRNTWDTEEEEYEVEDSEYETFNCLREYYGTDDANDFIETIQELGINDLHIGNIGFINNLPVLVDYSGYNG